jgi:hypothetical protein
MIIQHEYPFAMVEHQGFIDFMTTVQPQFKMPGRQTLCNNCIKLYKKMKEGLMAQMAKEAKYISLTTDLWTASDLTGYMVFTAHYINKKWKLIKLIISFLPLPPPHTGQAISD